MNGSKQRAVMGTRVIFVLLVGLTLATVRLAEAQQTKVYRIGVVTAGGGWYELIDRLRAGLKQLGLEEGKQSFPPFRFSTGFPEGSTKDALR
jgi:hypothetical protein